MVQEVQLLASDRASIRAYVAEPPGRSKGGVVVVPEVFGLNSHIRSVAEFYASQGYLAVAVSTFERVRPNVSLGYSPEEVKVGLELAKEVEALPKPGVMQDLQSAVNEAAKAGKVGMVGYCWGGLLTWRAACMLDGISAAVPYYGGGITTPEEAALTPRVPVMAHFGEHDHWIPLDSVHSFQKAHPEVDVHLYAADHGFNCDLRSTYNAAAAMTARERTLCHFERYLAS